MANDLNAIANELKAAEKALRTLNSRALTLVRGRYGADSSERKKPVRRAAPPPA